MGPASSVDFVAIIEQLGLALFVFEGSRVLYQNPAAASLVTVSGTSATRRSSGALSLGVPTFTS